MRTSLNADIYLTNNVHERPLSGLTEEQKLKGTLKELITNKRNFKNLMILVFLWVAASFNMYMIGFYMKYIGGSIFVNTLITVLSEIPLSLLGGYFYHLKGPKIAIPVFFLIALVGGLSLLFWQNSF